MQARQKFDVIIAGSGITGLSTALHLENAGIGDVAMCVPDSPIPGSHKSPGLITGGQIDNFTRFSHNYGTEIATQLWTIGDRAFSHLLQYCEVKAISVHRGERLRLITSAAELREAEAAVSQLASCGLSAEIRDVGRFGDLFTDRVLAVQTDGAGGAVVNSTNLREVLARECDAKKIGRLQKIEPTSTSVRVHTDSGVYESEMLVLACHLAIGDYLPEVRDALISVADQWSVYSYPDHPAIPGDAVIYSANHTYEWGGITSDSQLITGGGRYLRKHAGIEAREADFQSKIELHLLGQFERTFSGPKPGARISGVAALDCRPCDELPLIGPMFGNSRIFLATGYMGNGLALGFYAGHCLTELISTGKSESCPRRLHPERLRSLEN